MNRPMVRIHNTETDEIIDREMNDDEFAQWQKDKAEAEARIEAEVQAATDKAALFNRLGITADEAKLLLS